MAEEVAERGGGRTEGGRTVRLAIFLEAGDLKTAAAFNQGMRCIESGCGATGLVFPLPHGARQVWRGGESFGPPVLVWAGELFGRGGESFLD